MSLEASVGRGPRRLAWLVGFAAVLAAALAVVVLDDDDGATGAPARPPAAGSATAATSSSAAASPTPVPAAGSVRPTSPGRGTPAGIPSTATQPVPRVDTSTVVWPWKDSALRYDGPVEAARGFATDFAGFSAPVVGPFQQGDSRSGEVAVRPRRDGPVSTVLVRQLGDGHWWVIGSVSSIRLDSPGTGDRVSSPLRLSGAANTYEGHVDVRIRQDGRRTAIGTGFVTGCQGELCPFDAEVTFSRPAAAAGAVLLSTTGGEDDQVWQITVVRVVF